MKKTIDDNGDFAYHMFKAITRLELQNIWMDYDKICAYMKKQEYARNFDEDDIRSYIEMYIADYNEDMDLFEGDLFDESEDSGGSFVIRLRDCMAASAIRKAFQVFAFPYEKTIELNEQYKVNYQKDITELKEKLSAIDQEREQLIDQLATIEDQLATTEDLLARATEPEPESETGIVLMCKPKRSRPPKKVV